MSFKSSVAQRAYSRRYRNEHLEKVTLYNDNYRAMHREELRLAAIEWRAKLKLEILQHYSPNDKLCCSWENCSVTDIDMLTLDHVNDDGAEHRRQLGDKGGTGTYLAIKQAGFPQGFQTLCWNHQWKKRLGKKG